MALDTSTLTQITHYPRMLFISQNNSIVIYTKDFTNEEIDPQLVACSLNAISIFVKATFSKPSVNNITIDDVGMRNLCIDDINITYLYEGDPPINCPVTDLAQRLVATDVWDMILDVRCQLDQDLINQLDLIVAELFG